MSSRSWMIVLVSLVVIFLVTGLVMAKLEQLPMPHQSCADLEQAENLEGWLRCFSISSSGAVVQDIETKSVFWMIYMQDTSVLNDEVIVSQYFHGEKIAVPSACESVVSAELSTSIMLLCMEGGSQVWETVQYPYTGVGFNF